MADTRQIASVTYRGFLPFRRHVESSTVVSLPYEEAEPAARACLGQTVADFLRDTAPQPTAVASEGRWHKTLRVEVVPEASSDRARNGVLGQVHWHARRFRRAVPDMEADIVVRPLSRSRTRLILEVTYRPPGRGLGAIGEGFIRRAVARSRAETFISRLAEAMEDAVTAAPRQRWCSTCPAGEVA